MYPRVTFSIRLKRIFRDQNMFLAIIWRALFNMHDLTQKLGFLLLEYDSHFVLAHILSGILSNDVYLKQYYLR
jgi:hypothetical protein